MIVSGFVNPQIIEVCQTVSEMSVKASDNVGITTVNMRIYNPNGALISQMTAYRTAGTNQAGTWANDWAIPCTAVIGQYRVDVQAIDAAGNATIWGSIPNFWVQPSTIQDKAAPVVVSGTVSPTSVELCKTISEISARTTDDVGVASVTFKLVDPAGVTRATIIGMRNSGSKLDGIWKNDWATSCSYPAGKYTLYAQATDEWQKVSTLVNIGNVDLTPVPVAPTIPNPSAGLAAMYITPYVAASSVRNATRSAVTSRTYASKNTYYFVSSLLFTSGQNSGLLSIGHLLSATSNTPAVCSVNSVATQDNTGGIFTLATVQTLTGGTCSITWSFAGTADRAATSTVMNVTVAP